MLSVPIKVIIRTESTKGLKDIIEKIEEIKKINPHTVIDTTIEIDLQRDSQKVITDLTEQVNLAVDSISRTLQE